MVQLLLPLEVYLHTLGCGKSSSILWCHAADQMDQNTKSMQSNLSTPYAVECTSAQLSRQ